MKVKATVDMDVDIDGVAEALARDPEQFAELWARFAGYVDREHVSMSEHGRALAKRYVRIDGIRSRGHSVLREIVDHATGEAQRIEDEREQRKPVVG